MARYDPDVIVPLFEMMAQVDRLAEICEMERDIAFEHLELSPEALDLAEQTINL